MASPRPAFICASCARALGRVRKARAVPETRSISSSAPKLVDQAPTIEDQPTTRPPRWAYTPERMKMPFRLKPDTPQLDWKVNEDGDRLCAAIDAFIGDAAGNVRGSSLFPEDIRWLMVTHKSFVQGARGFNEKLAFYGKRIVELQASLALFNDPARPQLPAMDSEEDGPVIGPTTTYTALEGLENITTEAKAQSIPEAELSKLARSYGLNKVVRWLPLNTTNLGRSGIEGVHAVTLYAIIGALALQKGGLVATTVVQERILRPLGMRP